MRAKILSASAGAGKTYRLAYKFVHDVIKHYTDKPYLYRAILAVTFTNKATEEMKSRILKELNELITKPEESNYMKDLQRDLPHISQNEVIKRAKHVQTNILHDYSRFTILTIDKFFQRILRAFIKELGLDLNYNIELDTANILTTSTDALIEEIPSDEKLQKWIMEFAQERIDENQGWDIRKNIISLGGEIFDESNKQTILNPTPKEELLKIIREAEARLKKIENQHKEIGAKALEIIDKSGLAADCFFEKSKGAVRIFTAASKGEIVELNERVRARAFTTDNWAASGVTKGVKAAVEAVAMELQPLLLQLCKLQDDNQKLIYSLPQIKKTYRSYALLQDIYRKVQEQCESEGVMLLAETKYILSRFVAGNDAPFIYEKIGNRFERYMIDEFQDTSLREWENFVPLLQNAIAQSEDESVLIVGDVKQSIYRWRGGDWRILSTGVADSLGKENTKTIFMEENWRSLKQVVEFNNDIIERIVATDNQTLNSELKVAVEKKHLSQKCKTELTDTLENAYKNHRQNAQLKDEENGYVRIEYYDKSEDIPIIGCIESAIERGYSYNDILILCRSKPEIRKVADILLRYKQTNNSFNIMTQEALVVGKAPISQFVIALLRLSQNPTDNISRAIVNDYLGRTYDSPTPEEEATLLLNIGQLTVEEAFEKIVCHFSLNEHMNEIAYLQAVHEQIITFCSSKVSDIQLFLKAWDEEGANASLSVEMSDNTIELSTIHKAKGLERKVVIIPCNWSINPRSNELVWATPSTEQDNLANVGRFPLMFNDDMGQSIFSDDYFRERVYAHVDNINLLYVAITRAKEELYLYIPSYTRNSKDFTENSVGKLIWERVRANAIEQDGKNPYIEYGSPIQHPSQNEDKKSNTNNIIIEDYPTIIPKIALRLPEQRYYEEEATTISPRNIGILMHTIMRDASDAEQIKERIESEYKAGHLSEELCKKLKSIISREFKRKQVQEWFSEWDVVRNESDILSSNKEGTYRPDRVMIKGDRAIVVDYKFGKKIKEEHKDQVKNYITLLRQMGYSAVEGYVWYLSISEVVNAEER